MPAKQNTSQSPSYHQMSPPRVWVDKGGEMCYNISTFRKEVYHVIPSPSVSNGAEDSHNIGYFSILFSDLGINNGYPNPINVCRDGCRL